MVAGEPKTARGRRTLALDPTTATALRQHRKRQTEERLLVGPHYAESGFAFTMPDGTPIHPNRFSLWFRRHARTAGLPAIRLHDMRHSYATAGLAAGVPPSAQRRIRVQVPPHDEWTLLQCRVDGEPMAMMMPRGAPSKSSRPRRRSRAEWPAGVPLSQPVPGCS